MCFCIEFGAHQSLADMIVSTWYAKKYKFSQFLFVFGHFYPEIKIITDSDISHITYFDALSYYIHTGTRSKEKEQQIIEILLLKGKK